MGLLFMGSQSKYTAGMGLIPNDRLQKARAGHKTGPFASK